jgi:hypothetical protein
MPLPFIVAAVVIGGLGALAITYWDELKQLAKDIGSSIYRTVKKSKNAMKMILKGFAKDDIFSGEFRLIKEGGKFILETFVYEFQQTPSWKIWENEELEIKTVHKESKIIDENEVPDDIKEELEKHSEIRETLELEL